MSTHADAATRGVVPREILRRQGDQAPVQVRDRHAKEHRSIKYPCIVLNDGFNASANESASCSLCSMPKFFQCGTGLMASRGNGFLSVFLQMKIFRFLLWLVVGVAAVSARAQFALNLSPLSPGTLELRFTRALGYYYCLEKSGNLVSGFTQASGWMLGDGNLVTWPVQFPTSPPSNGDGAVASGDTFSLYPFDNGKTLVTWNDQAGAQYTALIVEDDSFLPPLLSVPATGTASGLLLLVGNIGWNPAFAAHEPALLPPAQQIVLARLTSRHADVIAAASGGGSGTGVVVASQKHFFRIHRMAADEDGDGIDWATEVFILGTNPDNPDTDGDGIWDSDELTAGTDPLNPFNGQPPIITTYGIFVGDGQIGWANTFLPDRISMGVENHDRVPVAGYPAQVYVDHGQISLSNDGTGMLGSSTVLHTDQDGLIYFNVKLNGDFNSDCHVSVGIDYGAGQQWTSFTLHILGNPDGVAAPHDMAGSYNNDGSYTVSWQNATGATELVLERSLNDEAHYLPMARLPAGTTQWTDPSPPSLVLPRPPGAENVYYRANSTH